jgi:hypothetical protein
VALDRAEVAAAALAAFDSSGKATIEYFAPHVAGQQNGGGVFARVAQGVLEARLPATFGTAVVQPDFRVRGFSWRAGPVSGDLDALLTDSLSLPDYLGALNPQLLGGVALADILGTGSLADAPQVRLLPDGEGRVASFTWQTDKLKASGTLRFAPGAQLNLSATLRRDATGFSSSSTVQLTGFSINLADLIEIRFTELTLRTNSGQKPSVDAKISGVSFHNELGFLAALSQYLPTDNKGFDDPPFLDLGPSGIDAGYTLAIPTVGVGVFSLQNLSLLAGMRLPFTGEAAALRFQFSRRDDPFLVTLACLGGGGYLGLDLTADGIRDLDAALEFGGSVLLSLGVATGNVYVLGGIYFRWNDKQILVEGYLRQGGCLEVLGLVAVTVEFVMAMAYRSKANGGSELYGSASLTVEVEVGFWSKDVTLQVTRRFAGSAGDPTFEDTISSDDWAAYCHAFA